MTTPTKQLQAAMLAANIILETDSYKLGGHWEMLPAGTQYSLAYFESRKGAKFDKTVFFGLQKILIDHLEGVVVTQEAIEEAALLSVAHFGDETHFNREMWEHCLNVHGGKLPIRIRAVREGTPIPVSNVLMTVINTDGTLKADGSPLYAPLVGALESVLTHVWYPSTVASLSRATFEIIRKYMQLSANSQDLLKFMLHDFGYRGAATADAAATGGMAHIVNGLGTDTVPAMRYAKFYYGAPYTNLAFSVAATEHSIMTALQEAGEFKLLERFLRRWKKKILSCVADSYNYYAFVKILRTEPFYSLIKDRELPFVVRPDSVTPDHPTPEDLMLWTLQQLEKDWGVVYNKKSYKVINAPIRLLWGDGITIEGIDKILAKITENGYSAENIATFGMGGGLLQKVNRDTQRFAFKCCAQFRDGQWFDIYKKPLDLTKASKRGHLKLKRLIGAHSATYVTETCKPFDHEGDELITVFENGVITHRYTFDEVRANAAL
jgi:nicotinamide phosphoribosyltransferase